MKIILLTTFTLFLTITAFTQNKQLSSEKQDVIKLLCQKWVLKTMSARGKSANVPASEAMYVTYNTDGTYTDSSARFSVSHGTWIYDSKTQIFYMTETGGKTKTKIVKVTFSELIIELEYPTVTMTATYKRVD